MTMGSYLIFVAVLFMAKGYCDTSLVVTVEQGALQGKLVNLVTNDGTYYSFKGIPYAKAPVGDLRFKAPEAPETWTGIRNATEHGPKCAQKFGNTIVSDSEDCLFLNVYTQNLTPDALMPVMVYIHGGGYKMNSGNSENFGPDFLVQHDVVVVTINFRLGIFGFLCLDTESVPGNAGLKDQVAALQWIQANIAVFGGDPDNVTIMGQSSGGAAVGHHIASPMSTGLFNRAIIMSGTPIHDWNLAYDSQRRGFDVGKKLGYYTRDTDELLTFLQSATTSQLLNVVPDVLGIETLTSYFFKYFQFTPVIEKDFGQDMFILEDPATTLLNGNINEADVFIGYTNREGAVGAGVFPSYFANFDYYPELLPPRSVTLNCKPDTVLEISDLIRDFYFGELQISNSTMSEFIDYCGDIGFNYASNKFANQFSLITEKSLFFYVFSGYTAERNVWGKVAVPYGIEAAAHSDDLLYLFNAESYNLTITEGTDAYNLVSLTSTIFTNFAKYGNPTPDDCLGVTWPTYNYETREYVDINTELTIQCDPFASRYEFWEEIYALTSTCLNQCV